ncbi:hypothetical protein NCAS_0E01550 [Naumovozyma castellii]|uniref:Major facilitator superfamily (MFS) profile domain-containing protein n=1 Tax=Naumovozyma castellii TaxID=27288 RepID=G0VFF9_NAUCA|nr:hypothetical protein NCAS_0E01550 [Naumovozyma castellii CBS 4309]CCC70225.1 hypothetical protein NCAS_0E01550 [Naumovozyma castellii CBS 4309]
MVQSNRLTYHLVVIGVILLFPSFIMGMEITSLAVFLNSDHFIKYFNHPSPFLQGILMSSSTLGGLVGCISYSATVVKVGRITGFQIATLLWFIGGVVATLVQHISMIIIARIIKGVTMGWFSVLIPAYIGEIYPSQWRGRMIAMTQLSYTIAILLVHYLSIWFNHVWKNHWSFRMVWGLEIIPSLLFFWGSVWLPETPQWLTLHGEYTKAQKIQNNLAIKFNSRFGSTSNHSSKDIVTSNEDAAEEDDQQRAKMEIMDKLDLANLYGDGSNDLKYKELFGKSYWKQTAIGVTLQLLVQFSGINILMFYITYICEMLGLNGNTNYFASSIPYFINMILSLIPICFIDSVNRKKMTLAGSFPVSIIMVAIGTIMALNGRKVAPVNGNESIIWFVDDSSGGWILALCFLFVGVFSLTLSCFPLLYTNEIFPTKAKPKGLAFSMFISWTSNFTLTLLAPLMLEYLKWGTFILLGGLTFVLSVCIAIFFPDTSGLSVQEINHLFIPEEFDYESTFDKVDDISPKSNNPQNELIEPITLARQETEQLSIS